MVCRTCLDRADRKRIIVSVGGDVVLYTPPVRNARNVPEEAAPESGLFRNVARAVSSAAHMGLVAIETCVERTQEKCRQILGELYP